jgi:hypothetical protein
MINLTQEPERYAHVKKSQVKKSAQTTDPIGDEAGTNKE